MGVLTLVPATRHEGGRDCAAWRHTVTLMVPVEDATSLCCLRLGLRSAVLLSRHLTFPCTAAPAPCCSPPSLRTFLPPTHSHFRFSLHMAHVSPFHGVHLHHIARETADVNRMVEFYQQVHFPPSCHSIPHLFDCFSSFLPCSPS